MLKIFWVRLPIFLSLWQLAWYLLRSWECLQGSCTSSQWTLPPGHERLIIFMIKVLLAIYTSWQIELNWSARPFHKHCSTALTSYVWLFNYWQDGRKNKNFADFINIIFFSSFIIIVLKIFWVRLPIFLPLWQLAWYPLAGSVCRDPVHFRNLHYPLDMKG